MFARRFVMMLIVGLAWTAPAAFAQPGEAAPSKRPQHPVRVRRRLGTISLGLCGH